MNQENDEKAVDAYYQFVGVELFLPDKQGRKMMAGVTKRVKDKEGNPREIEHPALFEDHSLYEVSFTNGQT